MRSVSNTPSHLLKSFYPLARHRRNVAGVRGSFESEKYNPPASMPTIRLATQNAVFDFTPKTENRLYITYNIPLGQ